MYLCLHLPQYTKVFHVYVIQVKSLKTAIDLSELKKPSTFHLRLRRVLSAANKDDIKCCHSQIVYTYDGGVLSKRGLLEYSLNTPGI